MKEDEVEALLADEWKAEAKKLRGFLDEIMGLAMHRIQVEQTGEDFSDALHGWTEGVIYVFLRAGYTLQPSAGYLHPIAENQREEADRMVAALTELAFEATIRRKGRGIP